MYILYILVLFKFKIKYLLPTGNNIYLVICNYLNDFYLFKYVY